MQKSTRVKWETVPPLVEKIISARSVAEVSNFYSNGKVTGVTNRNRPFRMRDFSREIAMDHARAWRYIRGGIIPNPDIQKVISAWCRKHAKHLKP